MNTPTRTTFGGLAFTPEVKAMPEHLGLRESHARLEGQSTRTQVGPEETAFIAARDSFHLASTGENGRPYIQYRSGPKGFLRMLDSNTVGLAIFRGDRQYISTGNVLSNWQTRLFLIDYSSLRRLKIWAETEISEDPAMIEKLTNRSYSATIERAFLFRVLAFDWDCQQYLMQRDTPKKQTEYSASTQ
jgi:predicted pyridoxine 5'-phosphate oxidase superfamily flavin-nucleotide-binding protein